MSCGVHVQIECQSKEFHRKRDFYSEYNEAAARFKLVHGNKKPLSKPKRVVKGGEDANAQSSTTNPLPLDGAQALTTNGDSTNPNTNQINQNPAPTGTTSLNANPSAPTPITSESKAAEPPSWAVPTRPPRPQNCSFLQGNFYIFGWSFL